MSILKKMAMLGTIGLSLFLAIPAQAQDNYFGNVYGNDTSYRRYFSRSRQERHITSRRPMIRFTTKHQYFHSQDFLRRYPRFRRYNLPERIYAREVMFYNRDNPSDRIFFRNSYTGPFSVNRMRIGIDRDNYFRLSNRIDYDQNIDIDVDTGNNTVSFNTLVGPVTTGNVDIFW